jgi:hypothetical protein
MTKQIYTKSLSIPTPFFQIEKSGNQVLSSSHANRVRGLFFETALDCIASDVSETNLGLQIQSGDALSE